MLRLLVCPPEGLLMGDKARVALWQARYLQCSITDRTANTACQDAKNFIVKVHGFPAFLRRCDGRKSSR